MIRVATPADVPVCAQIVGQHELWRRYGYGAEAAQRDLDGACERGELTVAMAHGQVSAFAWVLPRGTFGRSDYLRLIGVSPDATGTGLGARLLAHVERRAGRGGMTLLVSDFNTGAQRFYERQGYVLVGRMPSYVMPDVDELMYYKSASSIAGGSTPSSSAI